MSLISIFEILYILVNYKVEMYSTCLPNSAVVEGPFTIKNAANTEDHTPGSSLLCLAVGAISWDPSKQASPQPPFPLPIPKIMKD